MSISLILRGVALAMGIAVVVLSLLNSLEPSSATALLGLGLACLALDALPKK